MGPRTHRGFTLLELMIVVAIIGLVATMSVSTFIQLGAKNATQSAANDIYSTLQSARSRSEQRGSDIYVMVFPRFDKKTASVSGGVGALFVYEDVDGDFLTGSGPCSGAAECSWTNFLPPNNITSAPTERDRLLASIYLDDYPRANVKFGKEVSQAWSFPFTSIATGADANGCSFCQTGDMGAVLFTDGQAVLLDNAGVAQAPRVGGFALQGVTNPTNQFLIGFVRATGLVTSVR